MKGLACILADRTDPYTRTLALELSELYASVSLLAPGEAPPPCALLLTDLDFAPLPPTENAGRVISFSRTPPTSAEHTVLLRPFRMRELLSLLSPEEARPLTPGVDFRTVTVAGETVALTECEAILFRLLYEAGGAPVARSLLAKAAFPEAADAEASLNVYIHYLRKKLERSQKKVIRAHRGGGYSLFLE
ncbi:MAG: winged helix-turn-helix transcriptional regulator [Clostridia bacterium]|nr:winged helix-turn-helix transcriptional regulator [Clostridia bacterium]